MRLGVSPITADTLVLSYHAVSPTWTAHHSVTPTRFERQISLLVERGYRGVTFTDAVSSRARGRVVAVTFDDAYRSVIELARPILDRFGLPATLFAPTDYVDEERPLTRCAGDHWLNGPHGHELTPMSWSELRTLADAGWEIGSHSGSHPHLTGLDGRALEDELLRSKAACERHLSRRCTSLAYPYGDVDARVVAAAARAGYRVGAALPYGRLGARDTLAWPRINVNTLDNEVLFRLKISPAVRRLRGSALPGLPGALRRVAKRLGTADLEVRAR